MSPARARARGGATPGVPSIDIHSHFFAEEYLRVLEKEGPAHGVALNRSSARGPAIQIGPTLGGPMRSTFWDLDARLKEMNRARVGIRS